MPKIKLQFYTADGVAIALCCSEQTLYNKLSENRQTKSAALTATLYQAR